VRHRRIAGRQRIILTDDIKLIDVDVQCKRTPFSHVRFMSQGVPALTMLIPVRHRKRIMLESVVLFSDGHSLRWWTCDSDRVHDH